jgi:predicted acetyltransferase
MADLDVRVLSGDDELRAGARVVSATMLGSVNPEVTDHWASLWDGGVTHGAVTGDGTVVGIVRWFPSEVSMAGSSLPTACVTAVAVLGTHRRQGLLRRMMRDQLDSVAEAEVPIALLVAAEWGIYGRYGYGPAIDACGFDLDATTARFHDAASGSIELADPATLRPHLESVHDRRWARTMGAVTRQPWVWDSISGVTQFPHDKEDLGLRRAALWRDASGAVQGAVAYAVEESWVHNRPRGKAEVKLLVGATPEAERELWRHLVDLDWITTISAGLRAVDDPVPLWLVDSRAAVAVDRSDSIWARVLDVPRVLGERRSALPGRAVIEVVDDLGYASGRWSVALAPDGAEVQATTDRADVRLPVHALGAAVFGGHGIARLHAAGWLDEEAPGGVARVDALLRTDAAPWCPTSF